MNRCLSSRGLVNAARCHADDIGRKGLVTRRGSDGSLTIDRISRFGNWVGSSSESLSFGELTAKDVVMQWVICDGNPRRGDRRNLFKPDYMVCGIGAAYHAKYELVVSMVFVSDFDDFLDRDLKSNVNTVRASTYGPGTLHQTQTEQFNIQNAEFSRTNPNVASYKSPTKVYFSPSKNAFENSYNNQYESFKSPQEFNAYDSSYKANTASPSKSMKKPILKHQEDKVEELKNTLMRESSKLDYIKMEYSREVENLKRSKNHLDAEGYESEYKSHYKRSPSPRRSPSPYLSPYNLAKSSPIRYKGSPEKHWHYGSTSNYDHSKVPVSDIYYNAKPWEREGGHEYAAKVMTDGSIVNWGGENSWPEGAVKCDEMKKTKLEGDKTISTVVKNYTMQDGSVQTHEYSTVDRL